MRVLILPAAYAIAAEVELRLVDLSYVRMHKRGPIVVTPLGRKAIKARDSEDEY